jgi:hypothetical protein
MCVEVDGVVVDELSDYFYLWASGGRLAVSRWGVDKLLGEVSEASISTSVRGFLRVLRDMVVEWFSRYGEVDVIEIQF